MFKTPLLIAVGIMLSLASVSCGGSGGESDKKSSAGHSEAEAFYKDRYTGSFDKEKAFIVISKKDLKLTVYAPVGSDTMLIEQFPVCLSKNKGQKGGSGDMKTPESEPGEPFHIKQIQDASDWRHDFNDGRGEILAYGHWFLRLETPFSGIGIHGSTNNENSVPGRASEGCIRLLDSDIITLKEKYARIGMPVIIKTEDQGLMGFEKKK